MCCHVEYLYGVAQVARVEVVTRVQAQAAEDVDGSQFDLSVYGFTLEESMEVWHVLIDVLVELVPYGVGQVGYYAACQLGALILLLQREGQVPVDGRQLDSVSQADAHALEGDEAVFSDLLSNFKELDY